MKIRLHKRGQSWLVDPHHDGLLRSRSGRIVKTTHAYFVSDHHRRPHSGTSYQQENNGDAEYDEDYDPSTASDSSQEDLTYAAAPPNKRRRNLRSSSSRHSRRHRGGGRRRRRSSILRSYDDDDDDDDAALTSAAISDLPTTKRFCLSSEHSMVHRSDTRLCRSSPTKSNNGDGVGKDVNEANNDDVINSQLNNAYMAFSDSAEKTTTRQSLNSNDQIVTRQLRTRSTNGNDLHIDGMISCSLT